VQQLQGMAHSRSELNPTVDHAQIGIAFGAKVTNIAIANRMAMT
jgi:hypothetical protein